MHVCFVVFVLVFST